MDNEIYHNDTEGEGVKTFTFNKLTLRALTIDGEPWFIAMDVASTLGYSDTWNLTRRLDADEIQNLQIGGFGNRGASIINESGLYSAIIGSQKPEAKTFKKWVTSEVLPAIRKTGAYTPYRLPQSYSEALRELAATAEAKERLEAENARMKPIVKEYDEFMGARGTFTAEQAAKLLCRAGIKTGQNRLLKYMDSIGWTSKRGFSPRRAVQRYVDQGLIDIQATKYQHPRTREMVVTQKIVVTPKGLHKLRAMLLPPMDIELLEVS